MKITAVDAQQLIPVGADRIEWYNFIWDFLWCYIIKMSNQSSPNSTEIQAIFDQIAPEYDRLNQELSLGLHHIWKLMTEDKDVLEDLIIIATNNAKKEIDAKSSEEMSKITGGLKLPPGFKLPF